MSASNKNTYIQDVRGICIIAVIMIHSGIGSAADLNTLNYGLALRQFVYFPVAIFFFLSGYFCDLNKFDKWGEYFKKRIFRVLTPYLFWSFLCLLLYAIKNGNWSSQEIFCKLLTGTAIPPFYYLIVLIQLIIITPLLINIIKGNNRILKAICYSVTIIHLIILYWVSYNHVKWNNHYALCSAWFFFYYWGLQVKYSGIKFLDKISVSSLVILIICALFISVWEGFAVYSLNLSDFELVGGQVKFSSFLYVSLIILFIFKIQPFTITKIDGLVKNGFIKINWLTKIGDISFGIYLSHFLCMIFASKIVSYINFKSMYFPLKSLIITFLTLFICYYLLTITRKVIGDKYSKIIGII